MLIVLEGLDGSGKSTQVKMLTSYLKNRGIKTNYLHFPRFDTPVFGELIAKFLRGDFGSIDQVHPQLVALLFAEDRKDASKKINNWLVNNHCVILDRYVYSNVAFQCSKLKNQEEINSLREWILATEYNQFAIPKPNLNLFLDVPIKFVDSKLKNARNGNDRAYLDGRPDIHESNINFQLKVRDIYMEQCNKDKNFIRIDCSDKSGDMLTTNNIFEKIKNEVEKII